MSRVRSMRVIVSSAVVCLVTASSHTPGTAQATDALERGFREPPASARPRVWWHWMNGNVTREGITADLEWMNRVGIGGVQLFDASIGNIFEGQWTTPVYVDKRVVYRSGEWQEMLRHAAAECDRLRLEMTLHASGGWNETGGPWVKPEQAMKKLVWSETLLEGPRRFSGVLASPPSNNGNFQDLPHRPLFGPPAEPGHPTDQTYYADSVVVAYRMPDDQPRMADRAPSVTASGGDVRAATLMDGDLRETMAVPRPEGAQPAWFRPGAKLILDLGAVKEVAEVSVNGQPDVLLWRRPFRADITTALKPGANRLEIKVTNLWPNRMIGDQFVPEDERYTFSMFQPYKKDSSLLESGLLGPVTLSVVTRR